MKTQGRNRVQERPGMFGQVGMCVCVCVCWTAMKTQGRNRVQESPGMFGQAGRNVCVCVCVRELRFPQGEDSKRL